MTTLLLINETTLICENVSMDDRPASEIKLPGYLVLDLDKTECFSWKWNGTEWVKFSLGVSQGSIGCVYENGVLVEQKPEDPIQPVSNNTQEI
jgi:hypothetical protein